MKLAIIGSRTYNNFEELEYRINSIFDISKISLIISGGAAGADSLGEKFALKYNIPTKIYYPDWKNLGKSAGFVRNINIIKVCDILIAFWDGNSKGTKHSLDLAEKYKKVAHIILV